MAPPTMPDSASFPVLRQVAHPDAIAKMGRCPTTPDGNCVLHL